MVEVNDISKILKDINLHSDIWGPNAADISSKVDDNMFQPLTRDGRMERVWRVSDWTSNKMRGRNSINNSNSIFAFRNEENDASFSLIDNRAKQKPQHKRSNIRNLVVRNLGQTYINRANNKNSYINYRSATTNTHYNNNRQNTRTKQNNYRRSNREEIVRDPSVPIHPSWKLIQSFSLKDATTPITSYSVDDVLNIGYNIPYDISYDKVTPKNCRTLRTSTKIELDTTISNDTIITSLAKKNTATIYITNNVATLLMSAFQSIEPWDILITRTDENIFFDIRPGSNINMITSHESSSDILPSDSENINSLQRLSIEATNLSRQFLLSVLDTSSSEVEGDISIINKLLDKDKYIPTLLKYRKFNIDDITFIVRSPIHGYIIDENNEKNYIIAKMVNEFDSKVATSTIDWRTKFDSQSGAILAGEIKNNMCRMLRIAADGLLSGADSIKLGYVSRVQPRNPTKHEILRIETYPCKEFVKLLNITPRAMFSSLKYFFKVALSLDVGKYILLRDPNQLSVHIYSVPDSTFDASNGVWSVDIDIDISSQ